MSLSPDFHNFSTDSGQILVYTLPDSSQECSAPRTLLKRQFGYSHPVSVGRKVLSNDGELFCDPAGLYNSLDISCWPLLETCNSARQIFHLYLYGCIKFFTACSSTPPLNLSMISFLPYLL